MKEEKFLKVTCDDCEKAIIAGTLQSDPTLMRHLQECESCRSFAEFQIALLSAEPVIEREIPTLSAIKSRLELQKKLRARYLRFAVIPTAAAAAAALAIGGAFMQMELEHSNTQLLPDYTVTLDSESLNNAMNDYSMVLAWDQPSSGENNYVQSFEAAAQAGNNWSIEVFNPYNEDLL